MSQPKPDQPLPHAGARPTRVFVRSLASSKAPTRKWESVPSSSVAAIIKFKNEMMKLENADYIGEDALAPKVKVPSTCFINVY